MPGISSSEEVLETSSRRTTMTLVPIITEDRYMIYYPGGYLRADTLREALEAFYCYLGHANRLLQAYEMVGYPDDTVFGTVIVVDHEDLSEPVAFVPLASKYVKAALEVAEDRMRELEGDDDAR